MLPSPIGPRLTPSKSGISNNNSSSSKARSPKSSSPITNSDRPDFAELLEAIAPSHKESTREINELWRDLPEIERNLISDRSSENLQIYKEQIRSILKLILAKNTREEKLQSPIKGSSQKKQHFHVVHIDEKLKLLAETITHPQNSAFQILKQMDSIKGLLLDIQT
ncbi:DUF327 family protein [Leptospira sp. GIMC2001]|uniref:DUF327 family protein n=1 Tax=Leptospira sp. GIMC2001 TaxID=1513297 RepID=UPI0023499272|nr:DUF327 family protein [Leptospira sp. GIMC2001]WCL49513.1 DUF327 family protein [Leptospira sp. GIMC2001]